MGRTWCGDAMCELSSAGYYLVGCAHRAQSPSPLDCNLLGLNCKGLSPGYPGH